MPERLEQGQSGDEPIDDIAKIIVDGLRFIPPTPDNRVVPFQLTDEEIAYLRGDGPKPINPNE